MRILVDTSVWSSAFRWKASKPPYEANLLRALITQGESVFLTGVIVQELLQGIKEPHQFKKLAESLAPFPLLDPTREDHQFAAELWNRCRAGGTSVSTIDALIAGLSIRHECYLLTTDSDFRRIASLCSLKLLSQESS